MTAVARLLQPLADARSALRPKGQCQKRIADRAVSELLADTLRQRRVVWECSPTVWVQVLGCNQRLFFAAHPQHGCGELRQAMIAIAYLLGCFDDLPRLGHFERATLALKVFSEARIAPAVSAVEAVLIGWGYADHGAARGIRRALCDALLAAHSPVLADPTDDLLEGPRPRYSPGARVTYRRFRPHDVRAILEAGAGVATPVAAGAVLQLGLRGGAHTTTQRLRARRTAMTAATPAPAADLVTGLRRLKLAKVRAIAPQVLRAAKVHRQSPEEVLRNPVEAEITARDESNSGARLKAACFPVHKTMDEFKVTQSSVPQATFD